MEMAEAVAVGRRVLIVGYYGRGNPGDEALMEAAVRAVLGAGCVPVVATDDPSSVPPGVGTVPRTAFFGLWALRAVSLCDAVLFGGGGIFQDATSLRSLLFYANLALRAKARRKSLFLLAQGVGPLRRRISRRLVKEVFEAADMADVRDERSRDLLVEIGVSPSKVTVSADLSFLLAGEGSGLRVERRKGIALFPRAVKEREALMAVAEGVAKAAEDLGLPLRLVPFQRRMDERSVEEMATLAPRAKRCLPPSDWRAAAGEVASSELAVCVRLHALAFAAMSGTPAVAIPYDPKVEALAEYLGVPCTTDLRRVSSSEVYQAVIGAWEKRRELAERMISKCSMLRARAEEAVGRLKQSLMRGGDGGIE